MKRFVLLSLLISTLTITSPAYASYRGYSSVRFAPVGWGVVTRYAPGVMEYVRDYRIRHKQIVRNWQVQGWAAVPDCRRLGGLVTVQVGSRQGVYQIVDCAQPWDWAHQTQWGSRAWVELDSRSATRLFGDRGRANGYIWFP